MMKTIYIVLAYLMVWVNVVFTQNVFIKDYDPLGPANMKRVVPAKDGGFYIAGNNMVNDKTRLMKMDVNGDIVWEKYYGLPVGPTMMQEITQAKDGSFLIAGLTYGDITTYYNSTYLLKTDANGNQIFQKVYNVAPSLAQDSTVAEQAYSVTITKDNGILLTGSYVNNYTPNQFVPDEILYIRKTDSLGNELWRNDFGYLASDQPSRIITTNKNGYVVCGRMGIPTVCQGDPNIFEATYALLLSTDSSGNLGWSTTYGYENPTIDCSYGWFFDVIQTQDSNFIATGNWRGHVTVKFTENGSLIWKRWDIGGRIIKELASGELIILDHYNQKLVKTDAAGNTIWEKSYDIHANDMDIMGDDGFIMVGSWDNVNRVIKTDCEGNVVNPVCFSTGIDAAGSGGVMMLSGNPVSDVLRLRVADGGVYRVEIGDVLGRVHYSGFHSGGEVSLGTEGLTPGVYWIGVYGEEGDLMYSQKVLVIKN
ncbi:MAG: hypothetical protein K1X92_14105 [Bacteroidia bacterium]|nr:hypothetical protein [Bacteroidia bacterium]